MEEKKIDWRMLGNRISEMRIARGITQPQLAEMTGVSVVYIGFLEQGKRHGTLETYLNIVNALGFTLNDLLREYIAETPDMLLTEKISDAMTECGRDEKDAILRIVREVVEVVNMVRER